ncbi:gamma-glutamyltransferase [Salipaludibacillus aurantiacus]|uniref:Glutathione hydrolase proenzyme n=1 Tax=Salipaludibacillus aurantiacus TaxID=1601833 RepID=A0A1H9X949_9BACI|nr:gamma-glutamyltransferase [Salipaludibacillus aurantiacus]SES42670.1 gamma-glutamyltranspeptidase / glutathione hydrolase [Salipaludibacillus aurantiacus]
MKEQNGICYDFLETGRPVMQGTNGAVTSPHYLATQAGKDVLKKGGHAVEGAIAINSVLCVVYPHMAGLGGDLFALVSDKSGHGVKAFNGSGRSGSEVTRDIFEERGLDSIPDRGTLAANTVPGTVDAWWELHQQYGRLSWDTLFEQAIQYAEEGFPVSEKFSRFVHEKQDLLKQYPETAKVFLPDNTPLKTGDILKQPDLAWAFNQIAQNGREAFYEGEIAKKVIDSLRKNDGLLNEEDFKAHQTTVEEPLSSEYRGYTVHQLKPNTQGIGTLMMLNILEEYDLQKIGDQTPGYYHLMAEAAKIAFTYRDQWVTDPEFLSVPMEDMLSARQTQTMNEQITMDKAFPVEDLEELPEMKTNRDTTFMSVVDGEGNAVSLIQSIFHEFGSGFIPEGCGFLLQNRGSFFSLDKDHPNTLEPGKRTFHTIIPAMATKDGKPFMLFGSMGGEGQPQTQCALFTRVVDFGYNIQQAIEAPRWLFGRTWGEASSSLKLEARISDSIIQTLKDRGHEVEYAENYSQQMGHAQGIVIDPETNVYYAGADPRGDGIALSW